jgi:zinc-ribbon domain
MSGLGDRLKGMVPRTRNGGPAAAPFPPPPPAAAPPVSANGAQRFTGNVAIDLTRRRDQLVAKVAELQWDLGGLAYEMAIRNHVQVDVLVQRAATLQDADAELSEVERLVRMEESATAGTCSSCGAPHSSGATFCWQCGQPLLQQVSSDAILGR